MRRKRERKQYAQRLANGLCTICGKPHNAKYHACDVCRPKHVTPVAKANDKALKRRRYAAYVKLKWCTTCGNEAMPGYRLCGYCHEERMERLAEKRQQNRENGLCACGRERMENHRSCFFCSKRKTIAAHRKFLP